MWWDWTQISVLDSVLFSFVSIVVLYLVGLGFLKLLCSITKKVDPFGSFDFLQRVNFRILLGFIFVFLAIFIFSIFNSSYLASTLLIIALVVTGFLVERKKFKLKISNNLSFKNYTLIIIVFLVLLVSIFISSMLISGFYGSTNDDGAEHTLIVSILLNNPNSLITRTQQILYYPTGAHVLCGFFVTALGVSIQKIVIMVSAIFPCLIAVSFYSTIKCLFKNKVLSIVGLIIAVCSIGYSFGPLGWAGLPLLFSLYVSISSIGLIFVFLLEKKISVFNSMFLGIIFLIAIQTYPIALLIISLWSFLVLAVKLFQKSKVGSYNLRNLQVPKGVSTALSARISNLKIALAFLIPLLLIIPYSYSVYIRNIAGHQFSYLSPFLNLSSELVKARIGFNWLFDIPALSLFFSGFGKLFMLAPYSLILLIILLIPKISQRIALIFPSREFVRSLFLIYFFTLVIIGYLILTLYLPINFLIVYLAPERVLGHIFIPAVILTAVVVFSVVYFSYFGFKYLFQDFHKKDFLKLRNASKNTILGFALLSLLIFNSGLLIIPIITEQQTNYDQIRSSFSIYGTLSKDDLSLMNWIAQNIPSNAPILVSAGDSGQFVEAVTQKNTISRYSYLANYSNLMELLTNNVSDLNAIPLMEKYNVSYVYIGSKPTTYALQYPYYRSFNASQFLEISYFTLTKQIGDAWLFQFNRTTVLSASNNAE